MIKPDQKLYQWLQENNVIEPLHKEKIRRQNGIKIISKGLSECGYDLSLGERIEIVKPSINDEIILDPHNPVEWEAVEIKQDSEGRRYYDIPPLSFVIAHSGEYIRMALDYVAICLGKSTYARLGIITLMTPLEPGWEGWLTLEISNPTRYPARIYVDEGICQILFIPLSEPVSKAYTGAYQKQSKKPHKAAVA